ncbi:MerR family transcriptional regulator [Conexibacter woesei]|uniref:Transcriptional activator ligand binding domain protein n=1 Tax=Conexibacter woesei (strain DSM 14684 / CCUG 47730 / CIP 108061 / JCM 11494 / NBRC 100937 / ID131577) TaxID=469383 RepID=D3F5P5_CONWI|nr:GyrI-like domain-containing protein [Conexibacter woesei]ADB52594.1 transcriptional activator ligand binding domain protein [Conexibacter woesei DSM 14684]
MKPMMTVGQFARMTRLSAKQLRSWDGLGLLAPAQVDPDTGYRYYHPRQARTAVTIALLRSLDVPLASIRELLVADDEGAERLLSEQRERLQAELVARERALRALARLTADRELMPYEVSTATLPPRRLLGLRGTTTAERLHRDAAALVEQLLRALPWAAAPGAPPLVGLYPLDLDGDVAFAVGVDPAASAAPEAAGAAASRPDGIVPIELPGGAIARVTHVGSYDELPLAYFPLLAWLQERGHPAAGPVRETYLDDPSEVEPTRLRTEVSIPLTDPEDR